MMQRKILVGLGLIGLTGILAMTAFMAGRLLNQTDDIQPIEMPAVGDESQTDTGHTEVETGGAPEIPDERPAAWGQLTRRDGNSLFILSSSSSPGGGQEIEAVVTRNTMFYRDVSQDGAVASQLELTEAEKMPSSSYLIVWGEHRGDRVVATTILFEAPTFIPE